MKFSKIDNLASIGLMHYKFDGHTFVRSNYLLVKSILILFLALTTLIKYVLFLFFEQTDIIQLYIVSEDIQGSLNVSSTIRWFVGRRSLAEDGHSYHLGECV